MIPLNRFLPEPRCLARHRLLMALLAFIIAATGPSFAATRHYDAQNRLVKVSYPNGKSLHYVYDTNGNLIRRLSVTFVDSDHDGMDDSFETTAFGNLSRDGTLDKDGDGRSDLDEFLAGTDPNDFNSYLKSESIGPDEGGGVRITWTTVPGKVYRLEFTDDLALGVWTAAPGVFTATGTSVTTIDRTAARSPRRFYRLVVLS